MKKQWWMLSTIIILAIIAILQSTSVGSEELPKTGYQAPHFSLQALDGQTYSLKSLNRKPVVINFWASWCGPCKIEAPELVRLYDKYKDRVEIYAVNVTASDSIEAAKAFAQDYGFQFPVLIDEKGEVAQKYAIRPIPTTLFVNSEGVIAEQVIGLVDPQTMEMKFRQLLP